MCGDCSGSNFLLSNAILIIVRFGMTPGSFLNYGIIYKKPFDVTLSVKTFM